MARLGELGVEVHAARSDAATRRAVTLVDDARERTITTFGPRLEPTGSDGKLPWDLLGGMDAVYFTAGDADALRAARAARVLVASPRAVDALGHGVPLDALVLSADDAVEREEAVRAQDDAELVVLTRGSHGGEYRERADASGKWAAAAPPAAPVDSYGCGDSFAAGLTYGLGAGLAVADALALAARCGAVCLTGRGPYERQLVSESTNAAMRAECDGLSVAGPPLWRARIDPGAGDRVRPLRRSHVVPGARARRRAAPTLVLDAGRGLQNASRLLAGTPFDGHDPADAPALGSHRSACRSSPPPTIPTRASGCCSPSRRAAPTRPRCSRG